METDPKKILEKRLKMPRMSSDEARAQFERVQTDASRMSETKRQESSETGRVRED